MTEIDCLNRLNSTLLRPAVLLTVGTDYFFRYFFSFEMQNNSSQPKNEQSTVRKTRSTSLEKMAMLEEIYTGVSRCVFVFAAVSRTINQSTNQSIELSLIEKCCENLL